MAQNKLTGHYLRMVAVTLMWGGAFVAGRFTVGEVPPFTVAFLRFALAAALLWVVLRITEKTAARITRRHWPLLAALGFSGIFLYNALFFTGLKYTTAGSGSLIVSINPVVTTILAAVILRETVNLRQVAGILISFAGVAMVVTGGFAAILHHLSFNRGDLILLGAPVAWAFYSVLGKKAMSTFSPLAATTYACLLGAAMLFPFALREGVNWLSISPGSLGAIAFMAVFASVIAFNWWYGGVNALGAGRASIFINMVPLWTMLLAWIFLGEKVMPGKLLGGVLIITGVYLTGRANGASGTAVNTAGEKIALRAK